VEAQDDIEGGEEKMKREENVKKIKKSERNIGGRRRRR
jgi:hypothetical protein